MKIKKILIILSFILLSYSVYSLECSIDNDCDDDSYCTTELCEYGNCTYTNVSSCVKDNFKFLGDSFEMGEEACKRTYEYDNINRDEHKIILKRGSESISLTFDNASSNYYGHPITYNFNILNSTITLYLRYNETRDFLYLEDINKSCPVKDLCLNNNNCDDNNTCTIDECTGTPLSCAHNFIAYCKDNDNCCPSKCNMSEDNDCVTDQCKFDSDCDDKNPCTTDLCNGTPKLCLNIAIINCTTGDNCCPAGCAYASDKDCEKPIVCGDNTCEANETKDNCCKDCSCGTGYECLDNKCQKTKETIAKEALELNEKFKKESEKLISNGFDLKESLLSKTASGFDFKYTYAIGDKERIITGSIDDKNNIKELIVEGGTSVLFYVILVLIFLIVIAGLSVFRNMQSKKQEEKEAYYSGLLQQKFQKPKGPFYRR